ncbi:hypothetical protein SteCoe_22787 [Stentor coeruleus]|uniref:proton-translocating NAD(P)(+) transhydrogenase n=1 Tax=Stentor coeruleus TaxID=5963 RepID=A0A1R2BLG2_9CILI|nr:hypothetical protein SteCoe_22787 [Stentor coeruleus]
MEPFVIGAYMVCAILFILSLGGLSSQKTAKSGNIYGVLAMTLAIIATFFMDDFSWNFAIFLPLFLAGGVIGAYMALKVEMIDMPQMVAALHSFVGLAATMVSFSHFLLHSDQDTLAVIETSVGVFIGAVTFTGSVVAWGKLNETIRSNPLILCGWGRHVINLLCILTCIGLTIPFGLIDDVLTRAMILLANAVIAGFVGWHLVMAIGGADMPVVVSMLNSYSGWATSASGFLLENELLIITGALVGSSGAILSYIMCRAMNRSFFGVIAGGFGQGTSATIEKKVPQEGKIETIDLENTVKLLSEAKKIIIIPGYGMAVAKCQHNIARLTEFLMRKNKKVQFCIHPVAGRLPGHMNVLLAEADVDYNIVKEMDEVNEEFEHTDVVLVVGANDIVNPDALENPNSPIAGMPVCRAWLSKKVIVFKRGGGTGYAGIENPLFFKSNTRMFYGNADVTIREILNAVTELGDKILSDTSCSEVEHQEVVIENHVPEIFPEPLMTIGVPKEVYPLEHRIAMTPSTVKNFRKLGFDVKVEKGAGEGAHYRDELYELAGAKVVSRSDVWKSDIILKVRKIENNDACIEDESLGEAKCVISYVYPGSNKEWLEALGKKYPNLSYLAMECVPRISKAQKLDSLSSMANIGGYRAVLEAFQYYKRCPKPMMTAAGKLPPANVLVIGAGVAGLSAIGYCKSFGCIVKAMDTRSAAKADAESMGAKFIEVSIKEEGSTAAGYAREMSEEYKKAQYELTKNTAKAVDIIITTALIPGRPAPKLLDDEIIKGMKPGSVIVDMAAEMGGNCSGTKPGHVIVTANGVTIVGFTDLVSRMAPQSSELYANNLFHLLDNMGGAANFAIRLDDEIISSMCVLNGGKMVWSPAKPLPPVSVAIPGKSTNNEAQTAPVVENSQVEGNSLFNRFEYLIIAGLLVACFIGISYATYDSFMNLIMTFVLAVFIGYMVIWNVNPSLHTPLMSVTNAISGIIVIGAMLCLEANSGVFDEGSVLGMMSVFFASINIWGGFIVTYRMLDMFKTQIPSSAKGKHN